MDYSPTIASIHTPISILARASLARTRPEIREVEGMEDIAWYLERGYKLPALIKGLEEIAERNKI